MAASFAPRVSALAYFGGVAAATVAGFAAAMLLRPGFGHALLQSTGLEAVPVAAANSFYAVRVAPLFQLHCVGCHGAERDKGGLRLDSFAGALRGGKHGAAVVAGDPKSSEVLTRLLLPATDDRVMPPSGKAPLNADEITVIRLWIAAGASGSLPAGAVKGAPRLVPPVKMPEVDAAAVRDQRAPLAAPLARLQARYPGIIQYVSRGSADLSVDASLMRRAFGDADLRALAPLGARIVELDLSGTAVTDASAPLLAAMPSLRSLRLMDTGTSDAAIQGLGGLKSLKVLAVEKAGAAALAPLRRRGVRVYEAAHGE